MSGESAKRSAGGAGDYGAFVASAAAVIGLPIAPEHLEGVRENFERMARMAAPLLACAIPDEVEAAQVFEPGAFEL